MNPGNKTTASAAPKRPMAILGMGMVTSVGGDVESSCAAMRVRFNNFRETDFTDSDHQPIIGARAAVDPTLLGDARLVEMMVQAMGQTGMESSSEFCATVPLGLCTPASGQSGQPSDDTALLRRLESRLGLRFESQDSSPLPYGRASGPMALYAAQVMLYERGYRHVLLLAADSALNADALARLNSQGHLLSPGNTQGGLVPGEAAVALWLGRPSGKGTQAIVEGVGMSAMHMPTAASRPPPMTGRELATAIRNACVDAGCRPDGIGLRIADCNGLDLGFQENALAEGLAFKGSRSALPELWLPAECLGETGSACTLAAMAWACHAYRKGYLPTGPAGSRVLVHASNEYAQRGAALRGAAVLRF